jgi:RHS repeat-associated protein
MQDGWITAGFNALNQPMYIWSANVGWTYFGYDPLGRCVKRWTGDSGDVYSNPATYFQYDGWNLLQEGSNAWGPARVYVHGNRVDEIVWSYNTFTGDQAFHHCDARGHCTLLTDSFANIIEQYEYDAFGQPYFFDSTAQPLNSSIFGNRFLFTGREWLSDLHLYDYRNRIYQPELGRFLQPDPKEFDAGDYNLYRYCHNDPVNKSDPAGLVDRTWDRLMYEQGGEKRSFEVVEKIKDLHSNGWVTVGHVLFTERNKTDSTPGQPKRNLGGSSLDTLGGEMARMAFNTGPRGQEQISWLFEKNGTPGAYAASVPIAGGAEPKQFKEEGNQPRLGVSAKPTFIPKGYHYVGFAYSHLLADKIIPLIDRQRAWRNRLDVYLAVPHQGSSFPDVLKPYHYDPNVFPTN